MNDVAHGPLKLIANFAEVGVMPWNIKAAVLLLPCVRYLAVNGKEHPMAIKFAATMNAINKGLEGLKPAKAVDMIEDWEAALAETDVPGSKGIVRDLAALRKQLEKPEPDSVRVLALLFRLGEATVKISARAEKNEEKINSLGEALHEAGDEDSDEAEDTEAAAAPTRRGGRPPKAKK